MWDTGAHVCCHIPYIETLSLKNIAPLPRFFVELPKFQSSTLFPNLFRSKDEFIQRFTYFNTITKQITNFKKSRLLLILISLLCYYQFEKEGDQQMNQGKDIQIRCLQALCSAASCSVVRIIIVNNIIFMSDSTFFFFF